MCSSDLLFRQCRRAGRLRRSRTLRRRPAMRKMPGLIADLCHTAISVLRECRHLRWRPRLRQHPTGQSQCQTPAAAAAPPATSLDNCGGAGPCGGGLQCARCPGSAPTCARPPFQCCGLAGICGDGLQCATCPGSPSTCARPPFQCCGSAGVCGGGLVCNPNAPGGLQCQTPAAASPIPPQDDCGGAGPCGAGLQCARCPGSAPTCARPPFQCCGGAGICGAGLQCATCPGFPSTCARPPFQCCGSAGICGDGLVCNPTAPGGPVCVRPSPSTPVPPPAPPPPPPAPPKAPSAQTPSSGPAPGQFRSRWDQLGGTFTTGWVPNHPFQGCIHGTSCSCGSENFCGNYTNGQTTTVWPQGCNGPRATIRCTSEVEPAAKPKPPVLVRPPMLCPHGSVKQGSACVHVKRSTPPSIRKAAPPVYKRAAPRTRHAAPPSRRPLVRRAPPVRVQKLKPRCPAGTIRRGRACVRLHTKPRMHTPRKYTPHRAPMIRRGHHH